MEERKIVAQNVKRMRTACNFTQEQVADFLGIGRSAYSNYEDGTREMPLAVMEKLADLFGCDLYDLYESDPVAVRNVLATAFRVDDLSADDMKQIADFKCVVKNYLKMNTLLAR